MNKSLIAIGNTTIGNAEVNSVNSRELFNYLKEGTSTKYADWIKKLINEYNFTENIDYILVSKKNETNNGVSKTYIITIDMSKELCMLDKSERGSEARKYFIEQDNKQLALQAPQPQIDTNALAMTISTAVVQAMMSIQPNTNSELEAEKLKIEIENLKIDKISKIAKLSKDYRLETIGDLICI
jgi:phage anti-repressor protein